MNMTNYQKRKKLETLLMVAVDDYCQEDNHYRILEIANNVSEDASLLSKGTYYFSAVAGKDFEVFVNRSKRETDSHEEWLSSEYVITNSVNSDITTIKFEKGMSSEYKELLVFHHINKLISTIELENLKEVTKHG